MPNANRTPADVFANNKAACIAATAAGKRLHIGVSLSYVGNGSDKFWNAVWADNLIAFHFGAHGAVGQYGLHRLGTDAQAANKMWGLLRTKVAKGYTVVDAAVMHIDATTFDRHQGTDSQMIREWTRLRDARALNPVRPLDPPVVVDMSPRTPKQGEKVLLDITCPTPDIETMVAGACAGESERFLPPIVVSRPDAPEEAKFMAALGGTTKVLL